MHTVRELTSFPGRWTAAATTTAAAAGCRRHTLGVLVRLDEPRRERSLRWALFHSRVRHAEGF